MNRKFRIMCAAAALSLMVLPVSCGSTRMFVGLTLGYHWQGSLDWAVSMMSKGSGSEEQTSSDSAEKEKQDEGNTESEEQQKGPGFIEKSVSAFKFTMKS